MPNQPIEFEGRREPAWWHGWVSRYVLHMESKQLAPNTVETYLSALKMFAIFCEGLGVADPTYTKRSHVELYFSRMAREGRRSGARQRFIQLRPFFVWLAKEADCANPFEGLGQPKGVAPETQTLEPEQVQRILRYVGLTDLVTYRNRAIVRVLVDTGVRVSELCNIKQQDVDAGARTILITEPKGGRSRTVPFGHKTAHALGLWLRHRPNNGESRRNDRLFTTVTGFHLRRQEIASSIIQPMALRAGLLGVTPHVFRHTFAHLALLNGMSELDVMRIGGWSNQAMLRRYGSMLAEKRAKTAHDEYGPGERI